MKNENVIQLIMKNEKRNSIKNEKLKIKNVIQLIMKNEKLKRKT